MGSKVVEGHKLRVERLVGGDRQLLEPMKVKVDADLSGVTVTAERNGAVESNQGTIEVPADFVTDYSSIPTQFQWVVKWSKVDIAGVVHDFLYQDTNCSRKVADDVWRELAKSGLCWKANWFQAWLCWLMIRGFGYWCRTNNRQFSFLALAKAVGAVLVTATAGLAVAGELWCELVDVIVTVRELLAGAG